MFVSYVTRSFDTQNPENQWKSSQRIILWYPKPRYCTLSFCFGALRLGILNAAGTVNTYCITNNRLLEPSLHRLFSNINPWRNSLIQCGDSIVKPFRKSVFGKVMTRLAFWHAALWKQNFLQIFLRRCTLQQMFASHITPLSTGYKGIPWQVVTVFLKWSMMSLHDSKRKTNVLWVYYSH